MPLGEILLRRKTISPEQLEQILAEQHENPKHLGTLLLEHTLISQSELTSSLQEQYWRRNGYWVIE